MKLQIVSDLHLEFLARDDPARRIQPAADADLLVIAGDIAGQATAIEVFRAWPVPVVYVLGNHEFYRGEYGTLRAQLAALTPAQRGAVAVLDPGVRVITGNDGTRARIVGATLWTDFRLYEPAVSAAAAIAASVKVVTDFAAIRFDGAALRPAQIEAEHFAQRAWLAAQLAEPFDGRTVVVTHHAPSARSVHPRFQGDPVSAAFASNLEDLMPGVALWIHGHMHDSSDYRVGGCRVVANPRGYRQPGRGDFENPDFDPGFVVAL